ncbi:MULTISPECIES: NAD(P)/FAD-dependent oxidoreductase [unclassified Curtobacterium]|uniref:flavin-containing monooxygenase n=1 Tax=unclassified Curtobacterium TaxID=257496 RepID=UPI000F47DC5E|nr:MULTISPECIES: NAD(P)/FAD-dependent oxidoreductase [unclassified Curtobacterium]ROQ17509.1 cation diffusion facilitator CzcD-associated flavoprotein CzcO [Curtobacterium sp. PhB171]ROQ29246.1 cation diffusion facilitator CzcD-associated flavoprotein CzcO [Curtobacterium sp. PhB170]ROS45610.1 cation diffusion facilitator CzcD-associated flavoprotein CzcO [Curtobacterium sp. PhB131]ROS68088.1 cation diffusion facilitator CzcD-associated flavoprotein CzcO [Curtobacterium sp. PhB141]
MTDPTANDMPALRARYAQERDRRIRPDGLRQYRRTRGSFGYWETDPYTPRKERTVEHGAVQVLVVGGGFGGLLTASKLRQAGFTSVRMSEEGGDFGGTWYWNRYPGVHCDIESSIYMPLLEDVGTIPSRRYAPGEEIRKHAMAIARKFDLYDDVLFHTRVTELRWHEDDAEWQVATDRGDSFRARYVVVSSGTLSQPKLPAIPGIETFRGHTFHTSRWDYGYTGGTQDGDLGGLRDTRVAVVGTGATGIQVIPQVARSAEHLFVFQRTPSSVDVRDNRDLPPGWTQSLPPGWQEERMENFLAVVSGEETDVDLVQDGWTSTAALQRTMLTGQSDETVDAPDRGLLIEVADAQKMDRIRARVDAIVDDAGTAAKLKPWYRYMCKRPTFSDTYLQTFNRQNVTLIDTADSGGITAMTEHTVVVGDNEYEVDCVIFATGFETGVSGVVSGTLPVLGRGGDQLLQAWAEGPKTLHGFMSHRFPNLFHLGSLQNANSVNFVHVLQEQATHIAAILGRARSEGARFVEPTQEAQDAWAETISAVETNNAAFLAECTPGYYNGEGTRRRGGGSYSPGPVRFHSLLRRWRETEMRTVLHPALVGSTSS